MILIDQARWWYRERRWCHLVSDRDLEELHTFAAANGIPERGFQGDHYDVPGEYRGALIAAGAVEPGAASPAPAGAPGPDWPSEGMCSLMLLRPGRVARASEHPKKVRGGLEPAAATVDALQTSARHTDRRGQSVATRSGKDADCDLVRIF